MLRISLIGTTLAVLTIVASFGLGGIQHKLLPSQSWGYVQQTCVQG